MTNWKRCGLAILAGVQLLYNSGCVSVCKAPSCPPNGMVLIPSGTNSGTNPLADGESYRDWYPETYSLTVDSFYMDKYPVTKALWDEVYNWAVANGYSFENLWDGQPPGRGKASNHPVHSVSWYDVVKWCNARSEKEGLLAVYAVDGEIYRFGVDDNVAQTTAAGYRMPTSEEWEYAARGGLQGQRFPWGEGIDHSKANYMANGSVYSYDTSPHTDSKYHPEHNDGIMPYTSPVGSFDANGFGLYDIVGNVAGWTFDRHLSHVGWCCVVRGGLWNVIAGLCRVGHRDLCEPANPSSSIGFRTILPIFDADPLLTVINGSGGGSYTAGASVVVTASVDPGGRQRFLQWRVYPSNVYLGDDFSSSDPSTTIIMPRHALTLTATLRTGVIHGERE